jgi:hypothetical protein
MPETNRQWRLASRPVGEVQPSDFEWAETPLAPLADGEVRVRTLWLSFDPAMRGWMDDRRSYIPPMALGDPVRAGAVGQVVESKHHAYAPGALVQGMFGWQDYATARGDGLARVPAGVPPSWVLGVLGITGLTAYFGLLDVGKPKAGDVVVVSGAAGATGSIAGQIARIQGCRVIGIAGGAEKCRWLVDEARFDAAIDYKSERVGARLDALCPKGVDVYFDNVGGDILDAVLARIATRARVVLCGAISRYNEKELPPGPRNYVQLVVQRGRMEGFIVIDYAARFAEAAGRLREWVEAGEIVHEQDVQHGLENAPRTLLRLFRGENRGKQLLQLAEPPLPVR